MKKIIIPALGLVLILLAVKFLPVSNAESVKSSDVAVKAIESHIMAEGMVRSQNEAQLHFMTGGKLVYLPRKVGDTVAKGGTIASLDTYTVQKQLEAALNTYNNAVQNYDQTKQDAEDKVLRKKLTTPYDLYSLAKLDKGERDEAISDAIHRLLVQSKNNMSSAQIQVELARYAFTYSSITAPFTGVIVHEDVDTPNVVVSPQTTFTMMDPKALIFRVNLPEDQINYVAEGSEATIRLNAEPNKEYAGTVIKIYPDKMALPNGSNVYQIDIASEDLAKSAKFEQGGIALINNIYDKKVVLVPSWLVLNGRYVWTDENGKAVLKEVKTGDTNGSYIEITDGLASDAKLITDPKSIISSKYTVL